MYSFIPSIPVSIYRRAAVANICATMSLPTITFVTGNQNKLTETRRVLENAYGSGLPFNLVAEKIDLPELQGTPEEIARTKVKHASERVKGPVIVEDTCLCFNALKGLPGPYVKHFLDRLGPEGLQRMLHGFDDHSGYAQCTFAYSSGEAADEDHVFVGQLPGTIVVPRGGPSFGWDPVFQPNGYEETFAEMDKAVKSSISHRYLALMKLVEFLQTKSK